MADTVKRIKNLQQAIGMELAAVNQYLMHALTVEDWGLDKLAATMRAEMSEELTHAEGFASRLIFLGETPALKPAKVSGRAQSLQEMFEADLADEKEAIAFYVAAARDAAEAGDLGTRDMFERTALDEEGHATWLELQLSLLKRMGEPAYFAMNISGATAG